MIRNGRCLIADPRDFPDGHKLGQYLESVQAYPEADLTERSDLRQGQSLWLRACATGSQGRGVQLSGLDEEGTGGLRHWLVTCGASTSERSLLTSLRYSTSLTVPTPALMSSSNGSRICSLSTRNRARGAGCIRGRVAGRVRTRGARLTVGPTMQETTLPSGRWRPQHHRHQQHVRIVACDVGSPSLGACGCRRRP